MRLRFLIVMAVFSIAIPAVGHAADWQKLVDQADRHAFGNEPGPPPGRAATAADAELFAHTQDVKLIAGKFYPGDPKQDPSMAALDSPPRVIKVNFGPSLPDATVLIAYSGYYGGGGAYIAIVDAQHNVLAGGADPSDR